MNFKKELKRLNINQLDVVSKYMDFEKIFKERLLTEEQFLFVLNSRSTLNVTHDAILQYVSNTDMSFNVILKVAQTIVDYNSSPDFWSIILRQKCLTNCLTNLIKLVDKCKLPVELFVDYVCDEEIKDGDLVERIFDLDHITEDSDTWMYILGSRSCSLNFIQDNMGRIKSFMGDKMWEYIAMNLLTKKFIEANKDNLRPHYYIGRQKYLIDCVFFSTNLNNIPPNEIMYVIKKLWLNDNPNEGYDYLFSEIMRKCNFKNKVLKKLLIAVPFKLRRIIYEHQPMSRQYIKYDSFRNYVESYENKSSNDIIWSSLKNTGEWDDVHVSIKLYNKSKLRYRIPDKYTSARTILMNEIKYANNNLILNKTENNKTPRYIDRVLLLNQICGNYIDEDIVLVDVRGNARIICFDKDTYDEKETHDEKFNDCIINKLTLNTTCDEYISTLYGDYASIEISSSNIQDIYKWRNDDEYNLLVKLFEDKYYKECKQLLQKYGKTKLVDNECAENMFEIIQSGKHSDGHESVMELIFI